MVLTGQHAGAGFRLRQINKGFLQLFWHRMQAADDGRLQHEIFRHGYSGIDIELGELAGPFVTAQGVLLGGRHEVEQRDMAQISQIQAWLWRLRLLPGAELPGAHIFQADIFLQSLEVVGVGIIGDDAVQG